MKNTKGVVGALLLLLGLVPLSPQFSTALAQGTAFTYQGQLNRGGAPANGNYDIAFTLFGTSVAGTPVAGPVTNVAVAVSNGVFTTTVDLGNVFNGGSQWLELAVSTNGANAFTTLAPRQPLTSTPYAVLANTASNVSGTVSASQLSGSIPAASISGTIPLAQLPASVVTNGASGVNFSGTFSGNGSGLTNLSGSQITGAVGDGLLSSNVAFRAGGNAFTGTQTFNAGNVGIGTTSPLGYALDIRGNMSLPAGSAGSLYFDGANVTGQEWQFFHNASEAFGPTNGLVIYNGTAQSSAMVIAPSGNVGIGRTNPATTLDVNGTVTAASFSGDGSGLTNLNPNNLSAGTANISISGNAATATTANSATSFSGALAGDVTGTQGATAVATVGGVTAAYLVSSANLASAATSAPTANAIVRRDASGNFSAGTIIANLAGNAATANTATSFTGALAGDVTGTQGATVVSANFPRLNGTNVFTGTNQFNGVVVATNISNQISGSFIGSGAALTNLNAANLSGTISSNNIGAGSISSVMLATGAVGSNQLASNAVTTSALANSAVTAQKMFTVTNYDAFSINLAVTVTNPSSSDYQDFGNAVAAFGSDRVLIGADQENAPTTQTGAAYLYSTNGIQLATFTNPAPQTSFEDFGWSVAAVGTSSVLIGADNKATFGSSSGAAYLFNTNGTLITSFFDPTPTTGENFGSAVAALASDRVIIGAQSEKSSGTTAGTVYIFNTNGTRLMTITNPAPAANEDFGCALALLGTDRVIIGAFGQIVGGTNAGAAYLYNTNGTLLATFNNPTPAAGDQFGAAVAAVGTDRVLISAPLDNTGASGAGAAYLFNTNGTLLTTFNNPTPAAEELFGSAVAAFGTNQVLIGARGADSGGIPGGAVYVFNTNGTLASTFSNPNPATGSGALFGSTVAALGTNGMVIGAYGLGAGFNIGAFYLYLYGPAPGSFYTPGLIADGVRTNSITTASLADGAVTDTKLATISTAGKVADTALSTNVALLNGTNVFSATNRFAGVVNATNVTNVLVGTHSGNGAGLTGLNPANLSAGTAGISIAGNAATATSATTATTATSFSGSLAGDVTGTQGATVVSANIPRLNGTNVFTGTNQFTGVVVATNVNNQITGVFTGDGGGLTNVTVASVAAANITGTLTLSQLAANSVDATKIVDGSISDLEISSSAGIADSKLATISTAGKVADSALSTNVALLNRSIQAFSGGTNSFSNRVGIGTATPAYALDISGAATSPLAHIQSSGSDAALALQNTGIGGRNYWLDSGSSGAGVGSGNFALWDSTANAPRFVVNSNGNFGIGTTGPACPLDVSGTAGIASTGDLWVKYNVQNNWATEGANTGAVSIRASGNIEAQGFISTSDARIKNILGRSDNALDLQTLCRIEITDYRFKDVVAKGNTPQKKVIAQQVENVFPQAVSKGTGVVPDIFKKAALKDGWVMLATDLKKGDRVKLISPTAQGIHEVLEVAEGKFRTDFKGVDEVFVYGREVKDFRTVDYDAIAMLNVSATQELARKTEAQEKELNALRAEVTQLRSERKALAENVSDLEAGLARLEKAMNKRNGIVEASATH